jgi:amidase
MSADLIYTSAREMLARLRAKEISARELLDAHVAQHEQFRTAINAVIVTGLDRAYRDADAIDTQRVKGEELGALAGVPMTIKDGFDVANMPAMAGNPHLTGRDKNCADAELVRRARQGAVIWGKTNVPFMLGDWQSYSAMHGITNNPYDMSRTPGGSSGGAAAALASGITPLEIGSDIGGSLRIPASFCGVYALKPTWGVLPMRGHVPPMPGDYYECDLGADGPMARNAEDLRLLWNVLGGGNSMRKDVRGLRVVLWNRDANFPLAAAVKEGVSRAARALEQRGANVTLMEAPLDTRELLVTYRRLLAPILAAGFPDGLLREMEKTRAADMAAIGVDPDPWSEAFNRVCCTARFYEMAKALVTRQRLKDRMAEFFEGHDAILMPAAPVLPFPHDHSEPFFARKLQVDGEDATYLTMVCWIALATALHLPAVALPSGLTAEGLPAGVQLVGPEHGEDRLFDLAAAVEEMLGGFTPPTL